MLLFANARLFDSKINLPEEQYVSRDADDLEAVLKKAIKDDFNRERARERKAQLEAQMAEIQAEMASLDEEIAASGENQRGISADVRAQAPRPPWEK